MIFREVTERKENERKLRDALAEVEKLRLELEEENDYLLTEIRSKRSHIGILGQSPAIRNLKAQIDLVAVTTKGLRQISSALMVLKKVSTAALKLLYSSSGDLSYFQYTELAVDFADDVAFQASNDLAFALPVFRAFLDICKCRFVASHSYDSNTI